MDREGQTVRVLLKTGLFVADNESSSGYTIDLFFSPSLFLLTSVRLDKIVFTMSDKQNDNNGKKERGIPTGFFSLFREE
jgi:hypothetical protein